MPEELVRIKFKESRSYTPPKCADIWVGMSGTILKEDTCRRSSHSKIYGLHIVSSGKGFIQTPGNPLQSLSAGDMFCLVPGVATTYFPNENDSWEVEWLNLAGAGIPDFIKLCGFNAPETVLHPVYPELITDIFRDIYSLMDRPGMQYMIISGLYKILSLCFEVPKGYSAVGDRKTHSIIHEANRILAEADGLKINVGELASRLEIGRTKLFELFKAEYGVSPIVYINQKRIAVAKELLLGTALPLAEIAERAGFDTVNYFIRKFSEENKSTPGLWRKNMRLRSR